MFSATRAVYGDEESEEQEVSEDNGERGGEHDEENENGEEVEISGEIIAEWDPNNNSLQGSEQNISILDVE